MLLTSNSMSRPWHLSKRDVSPVAIKAFVVVFCATSVYAEEESPALPTVSLQDLSSDGFSADGLLDPGGRLSAFAVSALGSGFAPAVADLRSRAPLCIGGDTALPSVTLSDGSSRRTLAIDDGGSHHRHHVVPDCVASPVAVIDAAFDRVEKAVVTLLEAKIGRQLLYSLEDDGEKPLSDSPRKNHLHVYKKKPRKSVSSRWRHAESFDAAGDDADETTSDYLVPFHVDNGLFLVITHFPEHPLKVRLSDGRNASVGADFDGVLVLFGRGLTDWLLQADPVAAADFFPAPHAVPTMAKSTLTYRTVYARMKVVPDAAKPIVAEDEVSSELRDFHSVFMNGGDGKWADSQVCSVELSSADGQERDHWVEAMDATCAAGEAYCWMGCYPLPAECPSAADAACFSDVTNVTCGTEPGGKPMDPTCKWHCRPKEKLHYQMSDYCNGKMDMLMFGFDVSGRGGSSPCIVLFIEPWTLDSRAKFAVACVGVALLGLAIEAVIALRRTISRRKRAFLNVSAASRKAAMLALFAANLVLGYLAMLVAMTYSVELFCCVVLGLVVGHGVFNLGAAVGDTIDPCCSAQNDVARRKDSTSPTTAAAVTTSHHRGGLMLMVDAASPAASNGDCCHDEDRSTVSTALLQSPASSETRH